MSDAMVPEAGVPDRLRFSLPSQPWQLFAARRRIRTHLQLSPLLPEEIQDVVLCIEEACTNAMRHSGTTDDIDLELRFEGLDLIATVRDHGMGLDMGAIAPDVMPDPLATGGRGLFLMSRLMDEAEFVSENGLEVRMRKRGSADPERSRYRLADLIDVAELQELLDTFDAAFSCPTAIIDNEAKVLTASGWQEICTRFHRVHPDTLGECRQSDLHIYGHLRQGKESVAYVCPRGMIDCASPIVIEGRHLGNVFIGQVLLEQADLEFFRGQARRFGFDEDAYLEAARRVPVLTRGELERRMPFVRALAEMIGELGLARLRDHGLRREVEARAAESARLYEQQRLIAKTLQESLIHPLPEMTGLQLGTVNRTAAEPELIGGDFSDAFLLDASTVAVLIGDVAGKGIRAAGLTETVRSTVRAFAMMDRSPAFILEKANDLLLRREAEEALVTACLIVIETSTGRATCASAAHPAPVLAATGGCRSLPTDFGPPLGAFECTYAEAHVELGREEYLVLYTDGVTEARHGADMFGEGRVLRQVKADVGMSPQLMAQRLVEAAAAHADQVRDDMQVVVLQRSPGA